MKRYFFCIPCIAVLAISITTAWISDKEPKQLPAASKESIPEGKDTKQLTIEKKTPLFQQYLYNAQD